MAATMMEMPCESAFVNFDADTDLQQHPTMADPRLAIPIHLYNTIDDKPTDQLIFNESIWDTPVDDVDGSTVFFGGLEMVNEQRNHNDMLVDMDGTGDGDIDIADAATTASIESADSHPFSCASRKSSQSVATTISSIPAEDQKRTRRPSEKLKQQLEQEQLKVKEEEEEEDQRQLWQGEQQQNQPQTRRSSQASEQIHQEQGQLPLPPLPPTKAAKTSKSTRQPRQRKQPGFSRSIKLESGTPEIEDPKRSKFLERNRVAASKCRQKKKQWMQDLEDSKADLEKRHRELQRDYSTLQEEVSQLKNLLMMHSGCHDFNIDKWIGMEAARFVHGATPLSINLVGQLPKPESTDRSPTQDSFTESLGILSPAGTAGIDHPSPTTKDGGINYNYMPDDMFK